MKRMNRLFAVLCLALALCLAMPAALAADRAKGGAALTANMTDIRLVKGESVDVTLTYAYKDGGIDVAWDNDSVVSCVMSGKWDGDDTTMTVKAKGVGKSTVTLTNTKTRDVLKINVTVVSGKEVKSEVSKLAGKTVKAANAALPNALKLKKGAYDNGCLKVKLDAFKRIKNITLYAGNGAYRLFSIYPGMKYTAAASTLKKQGWKLTKKTGKGDYYLSNSDLFHAIRVLKTGAKVKQVIYYIP